MMWSKEPAILDGELRDSPVMRSIKTIYCLVYQYEAGDHSEFRLWKGLIQHYFHNSPPVYEPATLHGDTFYCSNPGVPVHTELYFETLEDVVAAARDFWYDEKIFKVYECILHPGGSTSYKEIKDWPFADMTALELLYIQRTFKIEFEKNIHK